MFLELGAAPSLFDTPQQDQHWQSSFLQPLSCGPHAFPILSTQPVWHGVMEMDYGPMIWEVDLKFTRLEAMGVMCWSHGVWWEISRSGGPSPCFPLSALPCSTSAHDCGVSVSPRRDVRMCSECLGKLFTLFSVQKKTLSHIAKQVPSFPWYLGQLIQ